MRKLELHRRLARRLGYDLQKFNKQVVVETHLRALLPKLGIDLVLDVGANVGQYARMLRSIGYRGRIISFEPGAVAFTALERKAAQDVCWQCINCALGERAGTAELRRAGKDVFSSMHTHSKFGVEKFGANILAEEVETVRIQRLDDFLMQHVPEFADKNVFLKMDTQGHDGAVFAGAGAYRARFAGLQAEISVVPIYEHVPSYVDMLRTFREHGYEVTGLYTVNRDRRTGHVIEFDCVMAPRPASPTPTSRL